MADMQDFDSADLGELETVAKQLEETKPAEPELPEKYRGKSAADIAKMHEEAEKLIARQSREVGEVRKLADELIKSQLVKPPEMEKPKEIDFFDDPKEAIRQAVESNPKVIAAEQYSMQAHRAQAQQALLQKHPDLYQTVQEPEFQQWVGASRIRQQLFQQADAYDTSAADELLSTFKELRQARQQAVAKVDNTARDESLKAAQVDVGGTGESGKKVYRRADLINLRIRNPAKYESMQNEIMAAYQEGRVK